VSEIRNLTEEHFSEFVRISTEAYPGTRVFTPEGRERAKEVLKKWLKDTRRTLYGAFRNDTLAGVISLHDFMMNVRGAKVLAGGAGSLAVELAHKKQHVARDLMEFYLDHYYEMGAPMAVLWPFRPDFYRRMGFGIGAKMHQYRFKPESLPVAQPGEHVRFLKPEDIPALNDCHSRLCERRTGMVEESQIGWENQFELRPNLRCVCYEDAGRIQGYLIYRFRSNNPDNFLDNDIIVDILLYESRQVLAELLTFLRIQGDQVNRVVLSTPDDDFYVLLEDPRNGSGNLSRPVFHECHVSGVGIMYRVLNVRKMFELLADHDFGGVSVSLRLSLTDIFFPRNAGSLILCVTEGRLAVADSGPCEVDVAMDIADFSSLFMGAVGFRSLLTYGLAEISDAGYADTVHRLFATEDKPLCLADF